MSELVTKYALESKAAQVAQDKAPSFVDFSTQKETATYFLDVNGKGQYQVITRLDKFYKADFVVKVDADLFAQDIDAILDSVAA